MGWTAPRTWTASELVTKAIMDTHVKDNLDYLKTEADKLNVSTQSVVTGSRALGTNYQNTSGKTMLVTVSVLHSVTSATQTAVNIAYVKASSPPDTPICSILTAYATAEVYHRLSMSFPVPDTYYYKVSDEDSNGGASTLSSWTETTLH